MRLIQSNGTWRTAAIALLLCAAVFAVALAAPLARAQNPNVMTPAQSAAKAKKAKAMAVGTAMPIWIGSP